MSKLKSVISNLETGDLNDNHFARNLDYSQIVTAFFSKSPIDFLENTSIEDLTRIVRESLLASFIVVKKLTEANGNSRFEENITVTSYHDRSTTYVVIALPDQPFIVNTISECIDEASLTPFFFLHPIFRIETHPISCSFLAFPSQSEAEITLALTLIKDALHDLLRITLDYKSMIEMLNELIKNLNTSDEKFPTIRQEAANFLDWLIDGNFLFLGTLKGTTQDSPKTALGIFRTTQKYAIDLAEEVATDLNALHGNDSLIYISKLRTHSPIHRSSSVVNISLRVKDSNGQDTSLYSITGLLTSKARAQEAGQIPLIRLKLALLLELEELVFNSHDYKFVTDIIDTMPKDEALRLDLPSLQDIVHLILEMRNKQEVRALYRIDTDQRGAMILIVMPRERFNSHIRQRIQQRIEYIFSAPPGASEYILNYTNKPLIRFYFYVPLTSGTIPTIDIAHLENEIADIARSWADNLYRRLDQHFGKISANHVWNEYQSAFPDEYQAIYNDHDALFDLLECKELLASSLPFHVALLPPLDETDQSLTICLYSKDEEVTISRALPILDNLGFDVIAEDSSLICPRNHQIYLHRFRVAVRSHAIIDRQSFKTRLAPAMAELFAATAESDSLNTILIDSSVTFRSIALFRTYCALLWQITKFASRRAIYDSLSSNPEIVEQLWQMFSIKFDPNIPLTLQERKEQFETLLNEFHDQLREVTDITKDRILRGISSLISATSRTSYYLNKDRIAIKIRSRDVDLMPNPRPLYEIFVRSSLVEGVHLRNGPVSRGGIRWSDRVEDFRSEILGLMATQTMKNVLIVPDGAKGGFIVRNLPKNPSTISAAVKAAYQDFISALLSITDNRMGETVERPFGVICWDDEDPYLVVAADKGTASFSDVANQIAVEDFHFWLGDAFASGGSLGYDHKKYGITAKGAWESTRRHFFDVGFDFVSQNFTCIGIGDMSGDVFGNGALLSSTMKLLAAFDHRHIFLDPDPDPASSYQERKRLFSLPHSQWSDYQQSLISKGGGVFGRYEKEIRLTPEICSALALDNTIPNILSGEELISHILRAPVDLLFNGGIGTYVKAASQSHADVNDGTNDRVRIDAHELRAKIVVEGGNLGLTQKARVEFAEQGGRISTDAIDNSAGVDLSDHEVNLKIFFGKLVGEKKLTQTDRDQIMIEIAPEVVNLVIQDNRYHAALLSVSVIRSQIHMPYFHSFITRMVKLGYVTRHRDSLPDDDALNERISKKLGLVRPELAVCMAAAKRWTKTCLQQTTLPQHPLLKRKLLEYFPETLRQRFASELLDHPLADNIIATQVTNHLVNTTGVTFGHRMCLQYSVAPEVAITGMLAADIILGGEEVQRELWKLDQPHLSSFFLDCWSENSTAIRQATAWLLRNHGASLSLDQLVDLYQVRFQTLVDHADDISDLSEASTYQEYRAKLMAGGLSNDLAKRLALYPETLQIFEMLWTSRESHQSIPVVAAVYARVVRLMQLISLLKGSAKIDTTSKWESELLSHSFDEIRHGISLLTVRLIERKIFNDNDIENALRESVNFEQMQSTLLELEGSTPSVTAIAVVARQISNFRLK